MGVFWIVRRVHAILIETNRVRDFHGHSPDPGVDVERMKHLHEFRMKIRDGARNETQASGFTAGRHDVELVIDEIELYFEYSFLVWNRRRRKSSRTDVKWNFPPV